MKERDGDQPLPDRNHHPDIQSQVIADIGMRRQVGIERYGDALRPFNGRDSLRDLYEELIDATVYTKQLLVEDAGRDHEVLRLLRKLRAVRRLVASVRSSSGDGELSVTDTWWCGQLERILNDPPSEGTDAG